MIDFGFDKIALIGAVALIVIGPEKLPRVARTVGTLMGKARRYVADVKAEVNRSIELEELQKMKSQFESTARDVETSVTREINEASTSFNQGFQDIASSYDSSLLEGTGAEAVAPPMPEYKHPKKKWRLKRSAVPRWYKQRSGMRMQALSGAARVARYRPSGLKR